MFGIREILTDFACKYHLIIKKPDRMKFAPQSQLDKRNTTTLKIAEDKLWHHLGLCGFYRI